MRQYKKNAVLAGWYTGMYIISIIVLIIAIENIRQ